jgi:hypothetical protein
MIRVYHYDMVGVKAPVWPRDYRLVARVDTTSAEEAFRLTNHIDCDWAMNLQVVCLARSRSTSVGDVIVYEDGTALRCDSVGWIEINE